MCYHHSEDVNFLHKQNTLGSTKQLFSSSIKRMLIFPLMKCQLLECNENTHFQQTITWLIEESIDAKLIGNHFDNWLIIRAIFEAKMPNISWLQTLKCDDFLLLSIVCGSDLNHRVSDCWLDKTKHLKMPPSTLIFFSILWHFIDETINRLMIKERIGRLIDNEDSHSSLTSNGLSSWTNSRKPKYFQFIIIYNDVNQRKAEVLTFESVQLTKCLAVLLEKWLKWLSLITIVLD